MTQFTSPSALAKAINMNEGEKREFNIKHDVIIFSPMPDCSYSMTITKVILSEGKKGHTTMKVYGYKHYATSPYYKIHMQAWQLQMCEDRIGEVPWREVTNEGLNDLQEIILNY